MTTVDVDPGLAQFLAMVNAAPAQPMAEAGADAARAAYSAMYQMLGGGAPIGHVEDRRIPGPGGDLPIRVYRPEAPGPLGVLVWYHGGGFVIGGLDSADAECRDLAAGAGCIVVSVDYRLAPEHPFPAAVDDAWAAMTWVAAHAAELGGDPARLAVGGDSAGGNLAAVTALRARDEGLALRHQLLVYPVIDQATERPSREANGEGYFLTRETMRFFTGSYLDGTGADPSDPRISPLGADLRGVAPAHVLTAGFDPLRDEGEAYAEALADAGVPVVDDRYPTFIHLFVAFRAMSPAAAAAFSRAAALLREVLG